MPPARSSEASGHMRIIRNILKREHKSTWYFPKAHIKCCRIMSNLGTNSSAASCKKIEVRTADESTLTIIYINLLKASSQKNLHGKETSSRVANAEQAASWTLLLSSNNLRSNPVRTLSNWSWPSRWAVT